jgi:UDP-2,3-diacylglucosamine pyrophosphatase LpxH
MFKIFLGDSHLGHDIAHKEKFLTFLKNIECESLFLIGDIFDTWFKSYEKIKKENKEFFDILKDKTCRGVKIYYVLGNHENEDVEIDKDFNNINLYNSLVLKLNDIKVKVIHGGQFDYTITKCRFLMRLSYFFQRIILSFIGKSAFKLFRISIAKILGKDKGLLQSIRNEILNYYKDDFDAVIIGHTHFPEIIKLDNNFIYMNVGDWMEEGHDTYIEYDNGEFKLKYYNGKEISNFDVKQMNVLQVKLI